MKLFISYNHKDTDFVKKLKTELERSNINVTIDIETLKFGDSFQEFAEKSVRETDFTVFIVSQHSLTSVWVIEEILLTFIYEKVEERKKFLPISIDQACFNDEFYLKISDDIDLAIKQLQDLTNQAVQKHLPTSHYDRKRERLQSLRNNIDTILQKLNNILVADFSSDERFKTNLSKLIDIFTENTKDQTQAFRQNNQAKRETIKGQIKKNHDKIEIKTMSWNMAGAKLLGKLDPQPYKVASTYIMGYNKAWKEHILPYFSYHRKTRIYPDIIFLQECIGFVDKRTKPSGRWQNGTEILEQIFQDDEQHYTCFFFPAISSYKTPHPAKWEKYKQESGIKSYLPDFIEAQQGYGICIRDVKKLRKIWIANEHADSKQHEIDIPESVHDYHLCFEAISTTTGLYLGDRDTEPRFVIMGRMKLRDFNERYLNFLNVHLTTLKDERAGNIRLNRMGTEARLKQLELILDNIISAYQEATTYRIPRTSDDREDDIWIIAGDFNATEDSEEISLVKRMGFVDGNENKTLQDENNDSPYHHKEGTKWSLNKPNLPPVVVDYI